MAPAVPSTGKLKIAYIVKCLNRTRCSHGVDRIRLVRDRTTGTRRATYTRSAPPPGHHGAKRIIISVHDEAGPSQTQSTL